MKKEDDQSLLGNGSRTITLTPAEGNTDDIAETTPNIRIKNYN
ncbi:hypothetical protein [Maribacter polysiphoniae]|nr:hypothetical protein [Maribacter polysiphoniae]